MSFLPQLPANGPPWLPRFASSIADLFRRVLPSPLKLFSIATADLPPAADYLGGIIHDSTADTLKIALGAGWSSFSLSTHVHAAADVTFAPAGGIAATDVQAAIVELDTEKLAASSYTAADVLAKLLTVDGAGSGLDADLLDGMSSAAFAAASHSHAIADVTGLQAALDGKQPLDADLTTWAGITPAAGIGTFLATPSSANLLAAVTDETGTGSLVFSASPTFTGTLTAAIGAFSGLLTTSVGFRASGASFPAAGAGVELNYSGTTGFAICFDRSAGVYRQLSLRGSGIDLRIGGAVMVDMTGAGIDVAGLVQCNSLRIDATPTATADLAVTHLVEVNMNGTLYQLYGRVKP